MTEVTIRTGTRLGLTACGHASGRPEVCAAISGLVFALAGYLERLELAGEVKLRELRLEPGFAAVEASGDAARPAFDMAGVGLEMLAESYPEQVRVRKNRGATPRPSDRSSSPDSPGCP